MCGPPQFAQPGTTPDQIACIRLSEQGILQTAQIFVIPPLGSKGDEWRKFEKTIQLIIRWKRMVDNQALTYESVTETGGAARIGYK